jgi:hypothetical protein
MPRFRFHRYLGLPILAGFALALTGALAQQAVPTNQAAQPTKPATNAAPQTPAAPPPKADPAAVEALAKAVEQLDAGKLGWLDTTMWQKVDTNGLSFQSEGRYFSGPGHLLRLDLKVKLAGMEGRQLTVCDGATLWQAKWIGKDEPTIRKFDLKKVQDILNSPGTSAQLSDEFYKSQALQGVLPLLQTLKTQMVFTKLEPAHWKNHDVVKLTGEWLPERSKQLAPAGKAWPLFVPKTCTLYLGKATPYWPYRVEWWGPGEQNGEDQLLLQMEFREPKVYKADAQPPAQFANQFAFHPGNAQVIDQTEEITKGLRLLRNPQLLPGPRQGQ